MHGLPWVNHRGTHRVAAMRSFPMYMLRLSVSTARLKAYLKRLCQHSAKCHSVKTQPENYTANPAANNAPLQRQPYVRNNPCGQKLYSAIPQFTSTSCSLLPHVADLLFSTKLLPTYPQLKVSMQRMRLAVHILMDRTQSIPSFRYEPVSAMNKSGLQIYFVAT